MSAVRRTTVELRWRTCASLDAQRAVLVPWRSFLGLLSWPLLTAPGVRQFMYALSGSIVELRYQRSSLPRYARMHVPWWNYSSALPDQRQQSNKQFHSGIALRIARQQASKMAIGVTGCTPGAGPITHTTEVSAPFWNSGFSASRHALVNMHARSIVELFIIPARQRRPCAGSSVELLPTHDQSISFNALGS